MARTQVADMSAWPSLSLEGNLIAPTMVARIDRREGREQDEDDYRVRKGLTIRDEVSLAFRVGQAHFDRFAKNAAPSAEATRRFASDFLNETFGFDDFADGSGTISCIAGGRVPVVVVPPLEALDRRSPTLSVDRSRSPTIALQDYLNEREEALWGLVTNGTHLRLLRDNASLTRPAHIEADLAQIFSNEDAASFAALWLLIHRSRFGAAGTPATDCALERWRDTGAREGEAARDRLAGQVEIALRVLGSGFLEANPDLARRLRSGELALTPWFNELLRLVYRLIFLMVAEDRNLLHPPNARAGARKLYAEGYSLAALRAQSVRRAAWDRHHDRYEGMKIVFRALAAGEEVLGLPALGGLFGPDRLPSLDSARLPNRAFMEAVYRLAWLSDRSSMVPVNWRAMETEELGSVYESLLELQPQLADDGRALVFASDVIEQKGNQRKTTGSYYTPDSLVQALLDTALDPVLDRTEAEAEDPAEALLGLTVIDPACGSGHFLLAAARRIATRLARIRAEGTPSLADFRHALRDVARRCVHGVDRNPMAVELTKVALWIETVDPGRPLGFFDAQIRCGDALLGVFDLAVLERGIPDAAYKALTGDDKAVARHYAKKNKGERSERAHVEKGFRFGRQRDLMQAFAAMRAMPEDTLDQIAAKSKRLNALTGSGTDSWLLSRACDLYVAAFLGPKIVLPTTAGAFGLPRRGAETVPTSGTVWEYLRGVRPFGLLVQNAERALDEARAFHWPLEFPDIMARGGFDVVLGNPPWEVMQLSEKEYFATRRPEIAALTGAARKRAISDLEHSDPVAFRDYVAAKHTFDASNQFARESGRFDRTARGKINTYALFAELFSHLTINRAGAIVPTGIATDFSNRFFFDNLVKDRKLISALMFDNAWRIFPAIHPDTPFALITIGQASSTTEFASYLLSVEQLYHDERRYCLTREQIAAINPNTRTAPIFRSRADAELTAKICQNGQVFIGMDGQREISSYSPVIILNFFSGSNRKDAGIFEKYMSLGPREDLLPVLRGADIFNFDHRYSLHESEKLQFQEWFGDGRFAPKREVLHRLSRKGWNRNWLMGWRDITNATNERTVIASVLPLCATDDTLSLLLPKLENCKLCAALLANLNSLILDYAAQSKVGGTHIRKNVIAQFPILSSTFYSNSHLSFLLPRILELTYTSKLLTPFAQDLGWFDSPFDWDDQRRSHLRADLDAFYARAYGLSRDELRYILDPAVVMGPDYPSETFRVLKEKEIRQYGEYRTQRLVLAAWDRMEADGEFRELGL